TTRGNFGTCNYIVHSSTFSILFPSDPVPAGSAPCPTGTAGGRNRTPRGRTLGRPALYAESPGPRGHGRGSGADADRTDPSWAAGLVAMVMVMIVMVVVVMVVVVVVVLRAQSHGYRDMDYDGLTVAGAEGKRK